jgi:hypothetical protein
MQPQITPTTFRPLSLLNYVHPAMKTEEKKESTPHRSNFLQVLQKKRQKKKKENGVYNSAPLVSANLFK